MFNKILPLVTGSYTVLLKPNSMEVTWRSYCKLWEFLTLRLKLGEKVDSVPPATLIWLPKSSEYELSFISVKKKFNLLILYQEESIPTYL